MQNRIAGEPVHVIIRTKGQASEITPPTTVSKAIDLDKEVSSARLRELALELLEKGEEVYIYAFRENNREGALRALGRDASRSDLTFDWQDAAICGRCITRAGETQSK